MKKWKYSAADVALMIVAALASPFVCLCGGAYCLWHTCTGRPPVFVGCGTSRVQAGRRRAVEQGLEKEAPVFLPPRRRALTLPLPSSPLDSVPGEVKQNTEDQSKSLFFGRLPLEVREMIYKYHLCNSTHIHIFRRRDNRLGHYQCHAAHRADSELLIREDFIGEGGRHPAVTCTNAWIPGRWKDDQLAEKLPLLKACRRAYDDPGESHFLQGLTRCQVF